MPGLRLTPVIDAEVFERQPDGLSTLVHSTRPDTFLDHPCPICHHNLGVREPTVIWRGEHAHYACARRHRA